MRFPEIRVTRRGVMVNRVEWVDKSDTEVTNLGSEYREYIEVEEAVDLTPMRITSIETKLEPGRLPRVVVTFTARLVEVDGEQA